MLTKREIGDIGEKYAETYLRKKGYKILERNFLRKCGEIDIIAKKDDCIIFVEVKTRRDNPLIRPCEAVNYKKRCCLIKTATLYLIENNIDCYCRFDVCEVFLNPSNHKLVSINYIEEAFYAE